MDDDRMWKAAKVLAENTAIAGSRILYANLMLTIIAGLLVALLLK